MVNNIKRVKSKELIPAIENMLAKGTIIKLTVTGNSMYPFLREGIDSVELSPARFNNLRRGDIALARRDDGQYVLHRIFRKRGNSLFLLGDAQQLVEGPLLSEQVIAVVISVWRKDKVRDCSSLGWRVLSALWMRLRPFRTYIIYIYITLRKWTKY